MCTAHEGLSSPVDDQAVVSPDSKPSAKISAYSSGARLTVGTEKP